MAGVFKIDEVGGEIEDSGLEVEVGEGVVLAEDVAQAFADGVEVGGDLVREIENRAGEEREGDGDNDEKSESED